MKIKILDQPLSSGYRLGEVLELALKSGEWTDLTIAMAFVRMSGLKHFFMPLKKFLENGECRFYLGIDLYGTSIEALNALKELSGSNMSLFIVHNLGPYTFHPKVFLFKNASNAKLIIGSGNITEGGLYTNYEAGVEIDLDLSEHGQLTLIESAESLISSWAHHTSAEKAPLTDELIGYLQKAGLVESEKSKLLTLNKVSATSIYSGKAGIYKNQFFRPAAVEEPPGKVVGEIEAAGGSEDKLLLQDHVHDPIIFVMTLQKTDVGHGQTTKGTGRRSPEIFVPLAARNMLPEFWEWPAAFTEDPGKAGKFDRKDVKMRLAGGIISVNMMTWPDKSDFRLRSEVLRSAGEIADLFKMEKAPHHAPFDYIVEIVSKQSAEYNHYLKMCINKTSGGSKRVWGYFTVS